MHKPDNLSRMVMHATRDITAGEELCIAYFDLTERPTTEGRRAFLREYFNFVCECSRCESEVE